MNARQAILKANADGLRHKDTDICWSYYNHVLQVAYNYGHAGIDLSGQPDFAGLRYGLAPSTGVSYNHTDNRCEGGLSLAVRPNGSEVGSAVWFADRKPHTYTGLLSPICGSDGEALILSYTHTDWTMDY